MQKSQTTLLSRSVTDLLKWTSIGVVVFSVGYIAYKKLRNKKKSDKNITINSQSQQRLQTQITSKSEYSQFYFDKILEAQFIEAILGDPNSVTLQQIYQYSPKIIRDQFFKFTKQIRARRRLIRKHNQDQYINLVLSYEEQLEDLLCRSRIELADYLKIQPQQLDEMEKVYEGEQLRELYRIAQQNLQRQLVQFSPKKLMRDQILLKILQEQIGFVRNKMYERVHDNLMKEVNIGQNKILKIITAMLDDIVYQKFGYQWEDIENKIMEISPNNKILIDRNKYLKMMEADIGDFNYESLSSSEDQISEKQAKMSKITAEMSGNMSYDENE